MSFRTRLVLAFGLVALVPLTVLVVGVRREMTARLNRQAVSRVDAQADLLRNNLARLHQATRDRLRRYSQELAGSNQFRLAMMAGDTGARRWLIDWAVSAMEASQFGMLQVQDSAGMILSSGHFRNQFGRVDRVFEPWAERSAANGVLIDATTPDGHIRVLAAMDSFQFAGRRYLVTGGPPFDLAQVIATDDPEVSATLALGDAASGPATDPVLARITLPYLAQLDSTSPDAATIVVTRLPDPMLALRRSVDRWFLAAIVIVVSLSLALAIGIAARVSRPLQELAAKTEKVDLDRLEQDFATDRNDEIGTLSRLLGGMTTRLRASTERIRDAERRAVTGDLARQVNHDIKNGLAPIRHVLRHLHQVADQEPANLAAIYRERQGTLESSVDYLEKLAQHYARLSPALDRSSTAVNAILGDIALALKGQSATVQTNLAPDLPPVRADAVVLRRIMENLARNAVDALEGSPGVVRLSSKVVGDETATRIQIGVQDTGRGMNAEELNRAFDDFYTTKAEGTGLGLSVVRRLVTDLGGTLRVETAPSRGSHFIVELPVA